jgi:hypothetical protein
MLIFGCNIFPSNCKVFHADHVQYRTPYPESLGLKALQILGFSRFWIFMWRNFNTDKINNKNYMFWYSLSTILNLLFMRNRKTSKIWGGIIFIVYKTRKSPQLMPSTDQTSKLPSTSGKKTIDSGATRT